MLTCQFLLFVTAGRLATGDCRHNIHLWQPQSAASWNVDQRPYSAHTASVEDIQWSPSEASVCPLMIIIQAFITEFMNNDKLISCVG